MANSLDAFTQPEDSPQMQAITIRPVQDAPDATPSPSNPLLRAVAPEQPQPNDLQAAIAKLAAYLTDPEGFSSGTKVGNRLFGTGNEERVQTWPERMVRSGTTLAGDMLTGGAAYVPGLRREDVTDRPRPGGWTVSAEPNDDVIERTGDMAGLAGGGALAERPGAATLGSGPVRPANMRESLTPAVKWEGRIYKGQVGQEHVDIVPPGLQKYLDAHGLDLETAAAEDLLPDGYRSGFVDHKGKFLNHTQAAEYAATAPDLVHPEYRDYIKEHGPNRKGVLTSDMLWSDTSIP